MQLLLFSTVRFALPHKIKVVIYALLRLKILQGTKFGKCVIQHRLIASLGYSGESIYEKDCSDCITFFSLLKKKIPS